MSSPIPSIGARIESLTESTNLTWRMAVQGYIPDIDERINWTKVERLLQTHWEQSMQCLHRGLKL